MSTFFCYNKIGGKNMARIRKEPNRYWSKEEKLRLINEVLYGKSSQEVAKENDISGGMLRTWIRKYNEYGIDLYKIKINQVILYANIPRKKI